MDVTGSRKADKCVTVLLCNGRNEHHILQNQNVLKKFLAFSVDSGPLNSIFSSDFICIYIRIMGLKHVGWV